MFGATLKPRKIQKHTVFCYQGLARNYVTNFHSPCFKQQQVFSLVFRRLKKAGSEGSQGCISVPCASWRDSWLGSYLDHGDVPV